jgi:hypothetical protein
MFYYLGRLGVTDSTLAVVVGHFAADGEVKPEHFSYAQNDPKHNFVVVNGKGELAEYLITHFSRKMVLDLGFCSGTYSHSYRILALKVFVFAKQKFYQCLPWSKGNAVYMWPQRVPLFSG